jgi:YggT family protein
LREAPDRESTRPVFVFTNFVIFIAQVLSQLLTLYFWIVIISAVMSWIDPNPYNPIVRFVYAITQPVFSWVREHLPVIFGGIDLSPIVVIIGIQFIQVYLLPTLVRLLLTGLS